MTEAENGWVQGRPSPALLAWALERQEWGDRLKPNDMKNVASAEKRARGFVAEKFLSAWLRSNGVKFTENGGPDPLPDLELAGRRIGVRVCASNRTFQLHHRIYVFDRHRSTVDGWFFCGVEMDSGRYLLLGGVDRKRFLSEAEYVPAGGEVCRGFVAEEGVWVRRASVLTPPAEWVLESLR